jgi:hypothetical protein
VIVDAFPWFAAAPAPARVRRGRVRLAGRSWVDDAGVFWPLGGTLFWPLFAFHTGGEWRLRAERHLAWFASYGFDHVRVLGEVRWPLYSIDPRWPTYERELAALLDVAWRQYGLRVQLTLVGGGTGFDYLELARMVARVVRGREDAVHFLEAGNESYINGPDVATLAGMVRILNGTGCVTAATDASAANISSLRTTTDAQIGTVHPDRSLTAPADADWRQVRQTWDFAPLDFAIGNNEPTGPRASVAENMNPLQLATMRAVSILTGCASFVLHNGAGVMGLVDDAHNRPADCWDVPGIDAIMRHVRAVDPLLTPGLENWPKANGTWPQSPFRPDAFWPDGADHGCVRCYSAYQSPQFVSLVFGVKRYVDLTARARCIGTATDLELPEAPRPFHLDAGGVLRLEGPFDANAAYVVTGTWT